MLCITSKCTLILVIWSSAFSECTRVTVSDEVKLFFSEISRSTTITSTFCLMISRLTRYERSVFIMPCCSYSRTFTYMDRSTALKLRGATNSAHQKCNEMVLFNPVKMFLETKFSYARYDRVYNLK
jgi:hypothetical protein